MMGAFAFYGVVVLHSVAATLFFVDLARRGAEERRGSWAMRVLTAGAVLHVARLAAGLFSGHVTAGSLKFALSLCAVSLIVAFLVFSRRLRVEAMGVVVAPLALTLQVGAEFLSASGPATNFPTSLLVLHIAANVLGVGLFLLAGASGALYLFEERRLKARRGAPLHGRLPSLDALDLTQHRLLLAGFPLLTFGIVTGAVFATRLGAMSGASLVRVVLAYTAWVLVAGVLLLRATLGWRGRRSAYGTLAGVACVLLVIGIYVAQSGGGGG